jgi:hypothetical protein
MSINGVGKAWNKVSPSARILLDNSDWLREKREIEHLSSRQIAKEAGCGKKAVTAALRRANLDATEKVISKSLYAGRTFNGLMRQRPDLAGKVNSREWMFNIYITENRSRKEIAAQLNLALINVSKWLRVHGLKKDKKLQKECSRASYERKNGHAFNSDAAHRRRMRGRRGFDIRTAKGGVIRCHSSWEAAAAKFFDKCDVVQSFSKDAIGISYRFEGRSRTYYPDFSICLANGQQVLLEIKPTNLQRTKLNRAKWLALKKYCAKQDLLCAMFGDGRAKLNVKALEKRIMVYNKN